MVNLDNNVANLYLYTIHIDNFFFIKKTLFIPTGSTVQEFVQGGA